MPRRYDYRIAAGHDVALVSLVNIQDITPSSDKVFYPPRAFGSYVAGTRRVRADGTVYMAGYPSLTWQFGRLTRGQFNYLRTTYCNGGFSGKVTVYTTTTTAGTYARYNAVLVLPDLAELDNKAFTAFTDVDVRITRLVAL